MKLFFVILCILFPVIVSAQKVKVGDVIENPDHSRGVVFWISPEGDHGWMVALYDLAQKKPWGSVYLNIGELPDQGAEGFASLKNALADTAGYRNTAILRKVQGRGTTYAAQCVDFEKGWYLPAAGQVRKLCSMANLINPVLVSSGGSALKISGAVLSDYLYSSSSEGDKVYCWCTVFNDGQLGTIRKDEKLKVRPVRSFWIHSVEYDTTLTYQWSTGAHTPEISDIPSRTTVYKVVAKTAVGCESSARREVLVTSSDPVIIKDTICAGEIYRQYGFEASATGEYSGTLMNAMGCEQKIILQLKVLDPVEQIILDTICAGEMYRKYNFSVWEEGEYKQVWRRANGCDSTVILKLTVRPTYVNLFSEIICSGETYTEHGFHASEPAVYEKHLSSVDGCDSLLILDLKVLPASRHETVYDTICEGEVYDKNGFSETVAGNYDLTLQAENGCDSLVTLYLTVHPAYHQEFYDTICEGDVYHQNGFYETRAGHYEHAFLTVHGCDSLVTLHLTVNPAYHKELYDTICEGEIYNQNGFAESSSGEYHQFLHTCRGCDSLVTLHLTVNPAYHQEFYDTICEGDVYNRYGFTESLPGEYRQLLQTCRGCDSLVILHLTVNPVYHAEFVDTICEGDVYNRYGFYETRAGHYEHSFLTVYGCDSLVTLHLAENPAYHQEFYDTICEGEIYDRYGFTESLSGEYHQLLQTCHGCDSSVTLHLTVNPVFDLLLRDTVCAGSAYQKYGFTIPEVLMGQECEPLLLKSREGCDSLVNLMLKVNPVSFTARTAVICAGEDYLFADKLLREAGMYLDTLPNQWGCDSILELHLEVNPVYCDTIRAAICAGERYQLYGFDETEAGWYKREDRTIYGCDSITWLELKVNDYFEGSLRVEVEDCVLHQYRFEADWGEFSPLEGTRYVWNPGDGSQEETGSAVSHIYADTGYYPIRLQVITPGDCAREWQQVLYVPYYSPDLRIYAQPEYVDSEHPQLRLWTDSIARMRYEWDLGDGTVAQGSAVEHTYSFRKQETYQITLERINEEDCRTRQSLSVNAYVIVNPPNTFSPNGDGINDYFMQGYRLRIIDRNGMEIFKGEDGWDGKRHGQPAPEDTYFYELYYFTSEGEKQKTGYITLVR